MEKAVAAIDGHGEAGSGAMSAQDREDFHRGVKAVLDYLEGFWMGLEQRTPGPATKWESLMQRRAS
jgi:hypothetical protein